jgi:hypothetical protein
MPHIAVPLVSTSTMYVDDVFPQMARFVPFPKRPYDELVGRAVGVNAGAFTVAKPEDPACAKVNMLAPFVPAASEELTVQVSAADADPFQ